MNPQELTKKHLTEDQNHIIKVTLHKKETLYSILKWWKTLTKSDTIGDLDNVNGNTALIHINQVVTLTISTQIQIKMVCLFS